MSQTIRWFKQSSSLKRTLIGACCVLGIQSQSVIASEVFRVNGNGNAVIRLSDIEGLNLQILPGSNANELAYSLTGNVNVETSGVLSGVTGNLFIRSNSANGTVDLEGLNLPGNLTIITSAQRDNISINNTTVENDLSLTSRAGNDDIRVDIVTVGGNVLVVSGGGSDDVFLYAVTSSKDFNISTGNGNDDFGLTLSSGVNTTINTGNGSDEVSLGMTTIEKDFVLNTGSGRDAVEINQSVFLDGANITLGDGRDSFAIQETDVAGKQAVFNGGQGTDTYDDGGENLFFTGDPEILNFENVIDNAIVYTIGSIGPGGGVVFDLNEAGTGGLEITLRTPLSTNQSWGCTFRNVEGLNDSPDGINIYDQSGGLIPDPQSGADKSNLINFRVCSTLANVSTNFELDGVTGWFLPSASELNAAINAGALQQLLPGYNVYWSSSEQTAESVFKVIDYFGAGVITPASKGGFATNAVARSFGQ